MIILKVDVNCVNSRVTIVCYGIFDCFLNLNINSIFMLLQTNYLGAI